MKFRTRQIHAGVEPDPTTGAILTPIHQSTTFVQESIDEYMARGYSYSRAGNPTVSAFEERIRNLEGGAGAAAYASGMAATVSVLMGFLNAGDHAIVSDVVYGGTHRFATQVLARFGVEFSFVDSSDPDLVAATVSRNTKLIFTETPANPTLKLTDVRAISDLAAERKILHAVDNTLLTPYYQRPLELGADLVVHSTTKYLDGHNATLGGAAVASTAEQVAQLKFMQKSAGSIMSPLVAWLTLQGTKTLADRMDRQSANALQVARFVPPIRSGEAPGLRLRGDGLVRSRRRSGGGQTPHAIGSTLVVGRELGPGRVPHHPSRHDDPW
jgi:cystathionine beta-lyase/cystathionine gamma-synthase